MSAQYAQRIASCVQGTHKEPGTPPFRARGLRTTRPLLSPATCSGFVTGVVASGSALSWRRRRWLQIAGGARRIGQHRLVPRLGKGDGVEPDDLPSGPPEETPRKRRHLPHRALDESELDNLSTGAFQQMLDVPASLWSHLMDAAEAEAASTGGGGDLDFALARAARGVMDWRQALGKGQLLKDATWPANPMLRREWTQMLWDLKMPLFTRRYPKILDPLMANLLETIKRFEMQESQNRGDGGSDGDEDDEGEGDGGEPPRSDAERASEAMRAMREQWQGAAEAIQQADRSFGEAGADAVAGSSYGLDKGVWKETDAWKHVADFDKFLRSNPELREIIRNLGRRSATKGPLRRLPEELQKDGAPMGVVHSTLAPAEASGVCLDGDWSTALPSEAQLLASGRPLLRTLHHAKRVERALLSYERTAWLEEEARKLKRQEVRPLGPSGPIILCLDTSGSMMGHPETVAKAVVLECLRQAHRQKRKCYLYAFSGQGQLKEFELSLTEGGLERLLQFLRYSFSGGTDLTDVLMASAERLSTTESWRDSDIFLVTDGWVPAPDKEVMSRLAKACTEGGTRIVGVVIGGEPGSVMQSLCTELYHAGESDSGGRLKFRPVEVDPPWRQRGGRGRGGVSVGAAPRSAAPPIGAAFGGASRLAGGGAALGGAAPAARRSRHAHVWSRGGAIVCSAKRTVKTKARDEKEAVSSPDYQRFTSELIQVIESADTEARRLSRGMLGTQELLLGLLTSPSARHLVVEALPGGKAQLEEARQMVEKEILAQDDSGVKPSGGMLKFTPMAQRALREAQQEQERLSHDEVGPEHLLLAFLRDERGDACRLLSKLETMHMGAQADDQALRLRVLANLSGPVPNVQLQAQRHIAKLREEAAASFAEPDSGRQEGQRPLTAKLVEAHAILTRGLVERSVEAKLLILAAIAGEHVFFLGPPGTAKSLLARRLAKVCRGSFFERLLTRFSVPEEIFGPLSLKALENDELRRKTEGFLPEADVTFLDEVFKANSSILNALLSLLNERVFDNGGTRVRVPLWCAVAASNELPESEELDALYDRFLLRRCVPRISDRTVANYLEEVLRSTPEDLDADAEEDAAEGAAEEELRGLLTAADSAAARKAARDVKFPDSLMKSIADLRIHLRDEVEPPVVLSDRRLAKAVRLLQVAAYAAGGTEVTEIDLLLLEHIFWDKDPAQARRVKDWVVERIGIGAEEDKVKALEFVLKGIKGRISRVVAADADEDVSKQLETLRAALLALQQPLEDSLRQRLHRVALLRSLSLPEAERPGDGRAFWLEEADKSDAAVRFLDDSAKSAAEAETALRQVLEMAAALELPAEAMEVCVGGLLYGDPDADDLRRSKEELDDWAAAVASAPALKDLQVDRLLGSP